MDINEVPYVYSIVQVLSYLFDMGNMETSRMASWILTGFVSAVSSVTVNRIYKEEDL